MLHKNSSLTSLKLSVNSISDTGASALAEALAANQKIASLDLFSNNIGDKGAIALTEKLRKKTKISVSELITYLEGLSEADTKKIFQQSTKLSKLNLKEIAASFRMNTTLSNLEIGKNLSSFLQMNTLLTNLSSLEISVSTGPQNTSLRHINLGRNEIGRDGATEISRMLTDNETMSSIQLGGNNLSEGIISAIENQLYKTPSSKPAVKDDQEL